MPASRHACPRCAKWMEKGYVLDISYGGAFQSSWVPGEPAEKRPILGAERGIKIPKLQRQKIVTYRCTGCGYLESFAM